MNTKPSVGKQIAVGALMLGVVVAIAVLGSLANAPHTDGWYADANKLQWSPPNWLFAPVWSVLYALIAVAGWLIWRNGYRPGAPNAARTPLWLYSTQLALNALWSPVFFAGYPLLGEPAWWLALVIIVALLANVIWLAARAAPFTKLVAWIMVPYSLWLIFATSLNAGVIVLN